MVMDTTAQHFPGVEGVIARTAILPDLLNGPAQKADLEEQQRSKA